MKRFIYATLFGVVGMLPSCVMSPTGRNQVLLFSPQQMSELGVQSFAQIKKQEKISKDQKIISYVNCVTKAISAQVPKSYAISNWEVVVFDSKQANAFALPGAKVGIYTGLLQVAKTQDQLAAVIGHEIAHVLANHSNERLSRSQITDTALSLTDAALQGSSYHGLTMAALGLGVQVGVTLPYSRTQESEADQFGLDLMASAGFDPAQAIELWKNMSANNKGAPPELLSTHPSDTTRISKLQNLQPQAKALYQQAKSKNLSPRCQRPV
ncbi:MAG: M48 family metallopeptidase [Vibrionaceae bacterium]